MAAMLEVDTPKVEPKAPEKIERCRSINMKTAPDDSLEKQLLEEAALGAHASAQYAGSLRGRLCAPRDDALLALREWGVRGV